MRVDVHEVFSLYKAPIAVESKVLLLLAGAVPLLVFVPRAAASSSELGSCPEGLPEVDGGVVVAAAVAKLQKDEVHGKVVAWNSL